MTESDSYQFMLSAFGGKLSGTNYRTQCRECGKKTLVWSENKPHPYHCKSCGATGNCYTLGYVDPGYSSGKSNLTDLERLVLRYQKKTGKSHRLSERVQSHFGLAVREYRSRSDKAYPAITIHDHNGLPLKRLVNQRWIALEKERMPADAFWLNLKNVNNANPSLIIVTAGEWDLFTLWEKTGLESISPVFGESPRSHWPVEHLEVFANKRVVILYDNDTTGRRGGASLAEGIARHVKTEQIKVVDLAKVGVLAGGDIDDFFSKGGTKERLFEVIKETQPFNVSTVALVDHAVLGELPERVCPMPDNAHSLLPFDVQTVIWQAGILPANRREAVLTELAMQQTADKKSVKPALATYQKELDTLNYIAHEALVKGYILQHNIVNQERLRPDDKLRQMYYENGVYKPLTLESVESLSDLIAQQLVPPDNRSNLAKHRKLALEDLHHAFIRQQQIEFDTDTEIINFRNGLYYLIERQLKSHAPLHYSTFQLDIEYDEAATCPNFEKALGMWFKTEEDRAEFLKLCYYAVSGQRGAHKMVVFYGGGGDGKGEAAKVLRAMIGPERSTALRLENLDIPHMVATLEGSWLNIADEVDKRTHINDGIIKALTGDGYLEINPKYEKPRTFQSKALWVILTNNLFSSSDSSRGFFRRQKFINFVTLKESEKIPDFFNTQLKPELRGIMNLILKEGRSLWEKDEGFRATSSDAATQDELERRNSVAGYWGDAIDNFLGAKLENEPQTPAELLFDVIESGAHEGTRFIDINKHYKNYSKYCEEVKQQPYALNTFRADTRNILERWFQGEKLKRFKLELISESIYLRVFGDPPKKKQQRVFLVKPQAAEPSNEGPKGDSVGDLIRDAFSKGDEL